MENAGFYKFCSVKINSLTEDDDDIHEVNKRARENQIKLIYWSDTKGEVITFNVKASDL